MDRGKWDLTWIRKLPGDLSFFPAEEPSGGDGSGKCTLPRRQPLIDYLRFSEARLACCFSFCDLDGVANGVINNAYEKPRKKLGPMLEIRRRRVRSATSRRTRSTIHRRWPARRHCIRLHCSRDISSPSALASFCFVFPGAEGPAHDV